MHAAMMNAHNRIKEAFKNDDRDFEIFLKIIDERWKDHKSHPLHMAGYFLNPSIYYVELEKNEAALAVFQSSFIDCMVKIVSDPRIQDAITNQLPFYTNAQGDFGKDTVIRQRATRSAGKNAKQYFNFINL